MSMYKKILAMSILSLAVVGCSNKDINNDISKEEIPTVEKPVVQSEGEEGLEAEVISDEEFTDELSEEAGEKPYTHDAGYTELIHGGFSMKFQELMEAIYSRVNYSMMGIAVEDVVPMEESMMTSIESMMSSLNPVQDGEILKVVERARELFDKTNTIIETKKYEKLSTLNEEGQNLYNAYYDWLIEAAAHHDHEH